MLGGKPDTSTPTDETYNPHRDIARWTRAVAWFTFALVVVSTVADFFIYAQYRVANDAQIDTRDQLRAVVTLSGATQVLSEKQGQGKALEYFFVLHFHNFGATRTNGFKAWDSIHYFPGNVPNSQDFTKPWQKVRYGNVIIGANSTYDLPAGSASVAEAYDVVYKKGQIILWGHAEWSDIFDPRINPINFCFNMLPNTITPEGNIYFRPDEYQAECNSIQ
jgi:hypothetical protein